jgi:DNA-binding HxlR family transcriptional regulator
LTFRDLQAACGSISSSVLNQRIAELRAAGVVDNQDAGYGLSPEGRRLLALYEPVNDWAKRWASRERGHAARH